MKIDLYKIVTQSNYFANTLLLEKMKKDGKFSVYNFQRINAKNVLQSEYAYDVVIDLIVGAIAEYHNQLREELKEKFGIAIEDVDFI